MRMMFVAALACLALAVGCKSKSPIDQVKNGVVQIDPNIKIGAAFDAYPAFQTPGVWSEFATEKNARHVTVRAPLALDKYEALCGTDEVYAQNKSSLADVSVVLEFEIENEKSFRFFNAQAKITRKDGTKTVKNDPEADLLYNIYGKNQLKYCAWLVE